MRDGDPLPSLHGPQAQGPSICDALVDRHPATILCFDWEWWVMGGLLGWCLVSGPGWGCNIGTTDVNSLLHLSWEKQNIDLFPKLCVFQTCLLAHLDSVPTFTSLKACFHLQERRENQSSLLGGYENMFFKLSGTLRFQRIFFYPGQHKSPPRVNYINLFSEKPGMYMF
jgi:hypothetical protein